MRKKTLEIVGITIQIFCVGCLFFFFYLAATQKNPVYFALAFLPYILIYNVIFRGFIWARWGEHS